VIYALTDAGREEVARWWAGPVERPAAGRDELAIKLALAVTVPGVDVRAVVQHQRVESLRALQEYTHRKRQAPPDDEPAALAADLVLDALIFAVESEARWLDHVEQTLLHRDRTDPHRKAAR